MDKLVSYSDSDSDSDKEEDITFRDQKNNAGIQTFVSDKDKSCGGTVNDLGNNEGIQNSKDENETTKESERNATVIGDRKYEELNTDTDNNKRKADIIDYGTTKFAKKSVESTLPLPDSIKTLFEDDTKQDDDTSRHDGRVRSFPHMEGNWATYLYIPYEVDEEFLELINDLFMCLRPLEFHIMEDFHLSLSRTVCIRHHWIQLLMDSIRQKSERLNSCFCLLKSVRLFRNDEKTSSNRQYIWIIEQAVTTKDKEILCWTKSFLAVQVESTRDLLSYTDAVNECFQEFKLQSYYEKPSYHISIGWCLGDVLNQVTEHKMNELQEILSKHLKEDTDLETFAASQIECKTGNKRYCFPLKSR